MNKKIKKLVFVTQSLVVSGGVVRVITNWSNYFATKQYEVENVSVEQGQPYFYLDKRVIFTTTNVKFRYKILKIIDILPNTIKLYKFLHQRPGSNVIFNKSLYIEPIWILRKLGLFKDTNLIYMHHGGSSSFRTFYLSRKSTSHRVSMIFNAFDKIVCLFDNEVKYPEQVDPNRVHFIPNPLTFSRSDIAFENKENIVLSLGRVTKEKGIDTLLHSWSLIEKSVISEWRLLIVGDGKDKKNFVKLVKKLNLDNVSFINSTVDVKPIYEKSKIFVIPSIAEGFPMTILEAMACKCCVLSSKTFGGVKLVGKKNGMLFDIGNKLELAEKLKRLMHDQLLREELALQSYKNVKQYEIEGIAKFWDQVFE